MSMKRVTLGLVVVLALGLVASSSHAFIFGCCCNTSCCAVAPYEVKVSYTPIQPQPGECTYCTCLPYGCPDGAPVVNGCPPGGACGMSCAPLSLPNPMGLLCVPFQVVGGVLNCACSMVSGLLGCVGGAVGCGCAVGGGCASCGMPAAQ